MIISKRINIYLLMLRLRFLVDNFTNFVYLCARII